MKGFLSIVDNVLHGSVDSFDLFYNMGVLAEHLKRSAFNILMSMKSSEASKAITGYDCSTKSNHVIRILYGNIIQAVANVVRFVNICL